MMEKKTRMVPQEAAKYLGCGYDKLMQMVRLKQINHYRIGRRVFFTRQTLDAWIREQELKSVSGE